MYADLMYMNHNTKVNMPEDFRTGLSQLISGMISDIEKYIQKSCGKCFMGDPPLAFPIYRQLNDFILLVQS